MPLMKKRATFTGVLNRVPAESAGEKTTYVLIGGMQEVMVGEQMAQVADVPVVVQAPEFGTEDLSGFARVTILIEQLPTPPTVVKQGHNTKENSMKFHNDPDTGDKYTNVKVTFRARKEHVVHAIAVQLDSGRSLHEITRTTTSETLAALCEANGQSKWPKPSNESATKAGFKCEDLFPQL